MELAELAAKAATPLGHVLEATGLIGEERTKDGLALAQAIPRCPARLQAEPAVLGNIALRL